MKKQLLTLLLVLVCAIALQSQPTPLDTVYRKVYFVAVAGASTYFASPVVGAIMDIEITDNKYPLLLNWQNGLLATNTNIVYTFNLSIAKRFKKYDIGINPIGFNNRGGKEFSPTMGVFATLRTTPRLSFNIRSDYNFHYIKPGAVGFTAALNYKLYQFKKL